MMKKGIIRYALAAVLLGLLAGAPAAADVPGAFEMTVIEDAAQGASIAAGDYDAAIERLERRDVGPGSRLHSLTRFHVLTNLCVAHTLSGNREQASRACDDALHTIRAGVSGLPAHSLRVRSRYTSMALSNRGVLHAVAGDFDAARRDFETADRLSRGLSAPTRNLARLALFEGRAQAALQDGH